MQATVTLSANVEGGFDVDYSSALGTAEATDVTVQGSSLSFVGTASETQTIDVVIIGDDIEENNETFKITLGDVTGTSGVQDAAITTGAVSDRPDHRRRHARTDDQPRRGRQRRSHGID